MVSTRSNDIRARFTIGFDDKKGDRLYLELRDRLAELLADLGVLQRRL